MQGIQHERVEEGSVRFRQMVYLPLAALITLTAAGASLFRIFATPEWTYNGSRLAQSFMMALGYPSYPPVMQGPALTTLYGPLHGLAFLPATWMKTPNEAVLLGSLLATLMTLVPFLLLIHSVTPNNRLLFVLASGVGIAFITDCPPLSYSVYSIHSDAVGISLAALACFFVIYPPLQTSSTGLVIAGFLASCPVWAKSNLLFAPVGIIFYLVFRGDRKRLLVFCASLVVSSLLLLGLFCAMFGAANLYESFIVIPRKIISRGGIPISGLIQASRALIEYILLWLAPLIGLGIYFGLCGGFRSFRQKAGPAWILLLVSLALLPGSIAGRAKPSGGDINSYSFTLYFFLAGLLVLACILIEHTKDLDKASLCFLLGLAACLIVRQLPLAAGIPSEIKALKKNETTIAWQYLVKHPGTAYFPWLPLAHAMAEKKIYHYHYGLSDRNFAGLQLTNDYVRRETPPTMQYVGFGNEEADYNGLDIMKYLPEYRHIVKLPELAPFTLYEQGPADPNQPCLAKPKAATQEN